MMDKLNQIAKIIKSQIPEIQEFEINTIESKRHVEYVIYFKLPDIFTRRDVEEFIEQYCDKIYDIVINNIDLQYFNIKIKPFGTPFKRGFHVSIIIPK